MSNHKKYIDEVQESFGPFITEVSGVILEMAAEGLENGTPGKTMLDIEATIGSLMTMVHMNAKGIKDTDGDTMISEEDSKRLPKPLREIYKKINTKRKVN